MDTGADIATALAILRLETESSTLVGLLYEFEDLYERKLWHQLTVQLDTLYYSTPEASQLFKHKVYESFVSHFASKLSATKVVDFLLESFNGKPQDTLDQLLEFKSQLVSELRSQHNVKTEQDERDFQKLVSRNELIIYADLQLARYHLILDQLPAAQDILDTLSPYFGANASQAFESSKVNAAFYLASCDLYKITHNYNQFYRSGLLYLSAIDNDLPPASRVSLCFELCIAALLGNKIYNFGELVLHEIMSSISDPQCEYFWLFSLIQYLNSGNLQEFRNWMVKAVAQSPLLAHHERFLYQKITLTALLELVSTQAMASRQLTFAQILEFTGVPLDDVEQLVIKGFSLGLIQGSINQIEETVSVTWLQPRILNLDQVNVLYTHLQKWDKQVDDLVRLVHRSGGSLWSEA